ncbi:MAG: hypothetical protein ACR2QT_11160 [Woeseiaceae bacterium]
MFKSVSNKIFLVAIVAFTTLVACSDSDEKGGTSAAFTAADSLLSYVPADSPYVLASLAPLPDDVMDKLEPQIDRILESYEVLLQEIAVMAAAEVDGKGADDEEAQKALAVVGELSTLMSLDGLRGAGIARDSKAVIYGNGLLPVMRLELTDGALFEAALARIEKSADEKMDVATISGNPVRYIAVEEMKILIAVLDTQVVVSAAPTSFDDSQLSALLGFTEPASSITSTNVLQGIASKYDYNDYFVGYVDIVRIAETMTGDASGLDAALFEMAGGNDDMSDVCRAEIRSMAGVAPRMVMGYTDISTERFDSQIVFEMREDIAKGLTAWPTAVPGLGGDPGGLMSFGMSIDVMAVREFYEEQLDAMEADPYECEYFADLQAGVAQGRMALQQPMPPMVYDFRGMVGIIQDIEGLDMAAQTPPTSVDGQFLFAMDNAPALVSLGTMMSPELAGLNLQADGEPVLLDLPQAQMLGGDVYLAMTDDAVAMSVGDGAEDELGDMLSADAKENGTFFSFSMDAGRYYSFMGEAMAMAEDDDDNPMSPKFQAAMQDMMLAVAEIYDRMSVDVRFTEDGIVIDSGVTLGD